MKYLLPLVSAALICSSTLSTRAGEGRAKSKQTLPPELSGFRERWESAMKELGIPGVSYAIVRGNEVVYVDSIGVREPDTDKPVNGDTYFYIASCTKSFVAAAVLTLVDDGKIDLNAPVKKYLPRFRMEDEKLAESFTVADLLSHAKGLSSEPIVFLDAYTGEITEDRFYKFLESARASGSWRYSNLHYTLLGRIIEAVTGKSWRDDLEERILKSVGMNRTTGYASRMYKDDNTAIPCETVDMKPVAASVRKSDATMHAAGGMGSSANDLARWLRLHLSGGTIDGKRVLSENSVRAMQTQQATGDMGAPRREGWTRTGYGYGWFLGKLHGQTLVDHGGGYIGASASISYMPEKNLGIVALSNGDGGYAEIVALELYARMLGVEPKDELPGVKSRMKQREEQRRMRDEDFAKNPFGAENLSQPLSAYVGTYRNTDMGTIRIEERGNELAGALGDVGIRFKKAEKDSFTLRLSTGQTTDGRFEVAEGKVKAVVFNMPDLGEVRFERE